MTQLEKLRVKYIDALGDIRTGEVIKALPCEDDVDVFWFLIKDDDDSLNTEVYVEAPGAMCMKYAEMRKSTDCEETY